MPACIEARKGGRCYLLYPFHSLVFVLGTFLVDLCKVVSTYRCTIPLERSW